MLEIACFMALCRENWKTANISSMNIILWEAKGKSLITVLFRTSMSSCQGLILRMIFLCRTLQVHSIQAEALKSKGQILVAGRILPNLKSEF